MDLPADWADALTHRLSEASWGRLRGEVREERHHHTVYPPEEQMLTAFRLTRFAKTRVVILGQDPYHRRYQAHGLAFSVPEGVSKPPSLRKIHQELQSDLGVAAPMHGSLESWARQGVLLLNTALTVREGAPGTHRHLWEPFTEQVIGALNEKATPVVFMLWGKSARDHKTRIDTAKHPVIESAHPAARSNAREPLLGSRPFTRANDMLTGSGQKPIAWESVCA